MSVFRKLFKVGEAKANELVEKLEKPELMLDQAIRDKEKAIREARARVQSIIATERQSKATLDKEKNNHELWEQRAQKALELNDEKLATQALARSETHQKNHHTLLPTWRLQRKSVDNLKNELAAMQEELDELKRNKDIIIAQSKVADVKKSIYEAKASIGKNNAGDLIARMKAKADRASFEADAAQELADDSASRSLESQFEKLEGPSTSTSTVSPSVKAKLEAMKAKLNK
ncbi:hypothetical protein COTS27_01650 [Spirochaetota bacterium]|nr:hypothetical protein COTS27_01650 [Spirochaetota bacterium]